MQGHFHDTYKNREYQLLTRDLDSEGTNNKAEKKRRKNRAVYIDVLYKY
jgi:hypothetical protein